MVKPEHLNQLLHPQFKDTESAKYVNSVVTTGLPASPGAAVGNKIDHLLSTATSSYKPFVALYMRNNRENCVQPGGCRGLVCDERSLCVGSR